jgi:hypothetical protein
MDEGVDPLYSRHEPALVSHVEYLTVEVRVIGVSEQRQPVGVERGSDGPADFPRCARDRDVHAPELPLEILRNTSRVSTPAVGSVGKTCLRAPRFG